MIRLIVGLGNPGLQYKRTRHNAGFLYLEAVHYFLNATPWQMSKQFMAEVAEANFQGKKILLIKPQTFMNLSGDAVVRVMNFYKILPEEMLVAHDEIDLGFGVYKLKRSGGHAGHNGLRDIIAKIGTADFYRLRLGVGRPLQGAVAAFVLSAYTADEDSARNADFKRLMDRLPDLIAGSLNALL